ncbi:MAG: hypothetical protein DHS20C21_01080 [Gemmatimonadota bacterium]|nr:MAG: hypothetical protein DHS20C21_01080 [Gemmatimonadota bacterium]
MSVHFRHALLSMLLSSTAAIANSPPVADAGPDLTTYPDTHGGTPCNGSATDPDGDPIVSWHWEVVSSSGDRAFLLHDESRNARFRTMIEGEYILALTASDGTVWSEADSMTIRVLAAPEDPLGERLAHCYAPVLLFAPGEEYLPTLPFFLALDGVDNDGDGLLDFSDPSEVAPGPNDVMTARYWLDIRAEQVEFVEDPDADSPGEHAVWNHMDAAYRDLYPFEKASNAVVFWTMQRTAGAPIWEALKTDPQFWRRLDPLIRDQESPNDEFWVIEYYLYYVRDRGITGHPHDIERVLVLVHESEGIFIVVGSAHDAQEPNNVSIAALPAPSEELLEFLAEDGYPDLINTPNAAIEHRIWVMVELGGHAMCPDMNKNASFDVGIDVSWHTEHMWGVRDVVSVTGEGATANYSSMMTFDRKAEERIGPPSFQGGYGIEAEGQFNYSLVSLERYKTVLGELANARTVSGPYLRVLLQGAGLSADVLNRSIPDDLGSDAVRRLSLWTADTLEMNETLFSAHARRPGQRADRASLKVRDTHARARHLPYEHAWRRQKPEAAFNTNLFPNRTLGLAIDASLTAVSDEATYGGDVRIGTPLARIAPIRLAGVLELLVGVEQPIGDYRISITYGASGVHRWSWFFGIGWTVNRSPAFVSTGLWVRIRRWHVPPVRIESETTVDWGDMRPTNTRFRASAEVVRF